MTEVIRRRIQQAFNDANIQETMLGDGALKAKVKECPEFTNVLVKGLSSNPVNRLLDGLSDESVREALQFALRVYNSHFIDARKIIRKISPVEPLTPSMWQGYIPYHIVVKALILSNRPVYNGAVSWVANIFGTSSSGTHLGPFLRHYIMLYLQKRNHEQEREEILYENFTKVLEAEESTLKAELGWLRKHSWIEFIDREHLSLTYRGRFILNHFVYDIEYLTHIATDVDMYEYLEEKILAPADTAKDRLNNLHDFIRVSLVKRGKFTQAPVTSWVKWGCQAFWLKVLCRNFDDKNKTKHRGHKDRSHTGSS